MKKLIAVGGTVLLVGAVVGIVVYIGKLHNTQTAPGQRTQKLIKESIMFSLNLLETVYESNNSSDGYVYRFCSNAQGTYVIRTRGERPLWFHAVLREQYSLEEKCFLPSNVSGLTQYFKTLEEALEEISKITFPNLGA
jgi:hypothetical protein